MNSKLEKFQHDSHIESGTVAVTMWKGLMYLSETNSDNVQLRACFHVQPNPSHKCAGLEKPVIAVLASKDG